MKRRLKYALWILGGYVGKTWSLNTRQKLTVLITCYNPTRMRNLAPQIRNVLRCSFVDRILISNHNPTVRIEDRVRITSERVSYLNQPVRRGCGYRWTVAAELGSEYFVVLDDDVLLFPSQLTKLFKCLLAEPEVPHGIAGMVHLHNDEFEYRESESRAIDFLCELYATTRNHVTRYLQIKELVTKSDPMIEMIDSFADFIIISQTGTAKPKIHEVGRIFRCETFDDPGIALHKLLNFHEVVKEVADAVKETTQEDGRPLRTCQ